MWHPSQDTFKYEINIKPCRKIATKRIVLSVISSIFDPTGLLGPVIVRYKIFIQQLWFRQISWDEEIPHDIQETWKKPYRQVPSLNNISIPRLVNIKGKVTTTQIHRFFRCIRKNIWSLCIYTFRQCKWQTTFTTPVLNVKNVACEKIIQSKA